ncbi:hypothetical protein C0J52_11798 [Blattella germanica]|nr:hypothetical protein C0J52_11798 [Blattella germanica]
MTQCEFAVGRRCSLPLILDSRKNLNIYQSISRKRFGVIRALSKEGANAPNLFPAWEMGTICSHFTMCTRRTAACLSRRKLSPHKMVMMMMRLVTIRTLLCQGVAFRRLVLMCCWMPPFRHFKPHCKKFEIHKICPTRSSSIYTRNATDNTLLRDEYIIYHASGSPETDNIRKSALNSMTNQQQVTQIFVLGIKPPVVKKKVSYIFNKVGRTTTISRPVTTSTVSVKILRTELWFVLEKKGTVELRHRIAAAVQQVTPDMLQRVWQEIDFRWWNLRCGSWGPILVDNKVNVVQDEARTGFMKLWTLTFNHPRRPKGTLWKDAGLKTNLEAGKYTRRVIKSCIKKRTIQTWKQKRRSEPVIRSSNNLKKCPLMCLLSLTSLMKEAEEMEQGGTFQRRTHLHRHPIRKFLESKSGNTGILEFSVGDEHLCKNSSLSLLWWKDRVYVLWFDSRKENRTKEENKPLLLKISGLFQMTCNSIICLPKMADLFKRIFYTFLVLNWNSASISTACKEREFSVLYVGQHNADSIQWNASREQCSLGLKIPLNNEELVQPSIYFPKMINAACFKPYSVVDATFFIVDFYWLVCMGFHSNGEVNDPSLVRILKRHHVDASCTTVI